MKVSEAFDLYRDNFILLSGQSSWTLGNHEICKRSAVAFFHDKDLAELSIDDIGAWHQFLSRERCNNTVRNYICKLRTVLRYCQARGVDCLNPDLIPKLRREDTNHIFLTAEEVSRMVAAAPTLRSKLVISLFYCSGIRLAELISLNRGQIVNGEFSIVGKGSRSRVCYIDRRTQRLLDAYLASRDDNAEALIVSYLNKERMTRTNVQLIVRNAAKKAGLNKKVTPHTLRHSFATNLIGNGADIRLVKDFLGHSNISTTVIYTHMTDPVLKQKYQECHSY